MFHQQNIYFGTIYGARKLTLGTNVTGFSARCRRRPTSVKPQMSFGQGVSSNVIGRNSEFSIHLCQVFMPPRAWPNHFLRAQHLNSERRWQVWQLCQVLGFWQVRFKMLQGLKRQSGRFGGHLSGAVHLQIVFLQNLEQSSVCEPQRVLASWCM